MTTQLSGSISIEAATELFWQSLRQHDHSPAALRGRLSIDDAYRVQQAILERRVRAGDRQVGWKVGLTSKALQLTLGHPEPIFGYLMESGRRASGCTFELASLQRPAVENELCMLLGSPLQGPHVSVQQAREAIASIAPSLEIIERRVGPPPDMALNLVDNVAQKAIVLGEMIRLGDRDLGAAQLEFAFNGQSVAKASGKEVLGDPVASLAWLANALARYGRRLQEGDLVMSGTFTPPFEMTTTGEVESEFGSIGVVRAEFL